MKEIYSRFILGDMQLVYVNDGGIMGICLFMADDDVKMNDKRSAVRPLAEVKFAGETYSGSYFGGTSMKHSPSTFDMRLKSQEAEENEDAVTITTVVEDGKHRALVHRAVWERGAEFIRISTEFVNDSDAPVVLEMLSSFAIYGLSLYLSEEEYGNLTLHRARSRWSMEGRLVSEPFEDLMLEECWCLANSNSERFGQVGSMPSKGYFPFAAVEDTKTKICWGAKIYADASWQMEITRGDFGASMSGGLADREFGHWTKRVAPKESFAAVPAVISISENGIDDLCQRLVSADRWNPAPGEEDMPIVFNEYCTTWGNPSQKKVKKLAAKASILGADYFVIDSGWYKQPGVPWDQSVGDYNESAELFPDGIAKTASYIKSLGMKPGIWFEPETVGMLSEANKKHTAHMLKRDGRTLTTVNRRFWDMNDPWVKDYLNEKVTGFLKKNGFEYIKIDYNETIGIGCDDEDSLGEGLRKNIAGTREFFKKLKSELPELVIENCSSGGNRLTPPFMELCSMASFSDAHECVEIPIIAANLHRLIRPAQSQIWCVLRKSDSIQRIHYSMSAAMLGRMCVSGDIGSLSEDQLKAAHEGIDFYRMVKDIIRDGRSRIISDGVKAYRHPEGWQCVLRVRGNYMLAVFHNFNSESGVVGIKTGRSGEIIRTYTCGDSRVGTDGGMLWFRDLKPMDSACALIKLKSR